jgi:hypothetical protein
MVPDARLRRAPQDEEKGTRVLRRLTRALWILLALVFLFEAWLWSHLAPVVAWVVDRIAWRELKARTAAAIEHLPPYPTLLVFLVPVILLLPIKFLGLWMLAHGSWAGAMATLALAKIVSMGVTAFIFDVTKPKLMQLPWFARIYDLVVRGLAWAHALVDPVKAEVKAWIARTITPIRRRMRKLFWMAKPGRAGRFFRHLARIRRRMRRREQAA